MGSRHPTGKENGNTNYLSGGFSCVHRPAAYWVGKGSHAVVCGSEFVVCSVEEARCRAEKKKCGVACGLIAHRAIHSHLTATTDPRGSILAGLTD